MAILEKEIWVGLSNKEIKYYENLGYIIPRILNKYGKLTTPRGSKINIKVDHLQSKSNVKVTKICDCCGKQMPNIKYQTIIISRNNGDGKDRCFECGSIKGGITQKNNIKYENSLEYYSIQNNKNYLLSEFSDKNTKHPSKISFGSEDEYLWNCGKCKSEYSTAISNRTTNNSNCPYCVGQRVNNTNCLWTTHPEIAKSLKNPGIGYEFSAGSGKKVKFKCCNCGNVSNKTIYHVTRKGFTCTRCSDGLSYPEKFMMNVLQQLHINFETQKVFEWSKNITCNDQKLNGTKKYDFYIPSLSMVIETHGKQHYEEESFTHGRTLKEEKKNDKIKEELAIENGIENYIVINCKYSEIEYIKNNIIIQLNNIFEMSGIDWTECGKFACKSLVKIACDLWNCGIKSTVEIGKKLKLSSSCIVRYLKQGVKLSWCDYDPKEVMKNNGRNNGGNNSRKIIQLTINNKLIKEWNSGVEAASSLNISNKIPDVCKGKRKSAGGYKWMYKEDYDKYISEQNKTAIL